MQRTAWWLLALMAACAPLAAQEADVGPGLLFTGDFEVGGMAPYGYSEAQTVAKTAIVDAPVRSGEHALMVTLDRIEHAQMTGHRTDFWLRGLGESTLQGAAYWYGVSTFVPADWQPDTQGELWVQWVQGSLPAADVGGPSLAIYVYGEGYCIRRRWGPGADQYRNLWRGDVLADRGRWVDWVFRVHWSPGPDGRVEVWRDGEPIAEDTGPNCVAAEFAPYFKFGIYKWPWNRDETTAPSTLTRRVLYFDEIRIADDRGSLQAVSPP